MKIQGSVALVTGSNRGLGRAIVLALLKAGAGKVYATARDEKKVSIADSRVVPVKLDTTAPEQISAAARIAADVTLLINNAGSFTSFNVLTTSTEQLDRDIRTNVHGTLAIVKAFVPILERARGGATIVNVLSMTSLSSAPGMGGYSASKAAAYSITQALRPELKAKRIDVLAVLPGPIDTDMIRGLQLPKANPTDAANALLAGIERGDEEIFPDPLSQQWGSLWGKNPKELEHEFAKF